METFDFIIKNATCLLTVEGQLKEESVDLGIKKGKIEKIGSIHKDKGDHFLDAKHLHVLPGLIDSQVHFREPGSEHKEDIKTGSLSALKGGLTGYLEMPNTTPPTTNEFYFNQKVQKAQEKSYCHYGFFLGATPDNLEEIKKANTFKGCCGLKIFMGSSTGTLLVNETHHLEEILKHCPCPIAVHSEDEQRMNERKHLRKVSDVSSHPIWRDEQTALISTKRIISLARKHKKKIHVLHVTTKQEVEFLKENKDICTFEITPQHLLLHAPDCYKKWGSLVQMNPPIRTADHKEKLWEAIDQNIADVIGSDHAPHTLDEKNKNYPDTPSGIPGVQTTLPLLLQCVHEKKLSLKKLVELMAVRPVKIYNIKNKGHIQLGFDGDFTIVDLKKQNTISKEWISYKCNWSPYIGQKITGWPVATILKGHVAMKEGDVLTPPQGEAFLYT